MGAGAGAFVYVYVRSKLSLLLRSPAHAAAAAAPPPAPSLLLASQGKREREKWLQRQERRRSRTGRLGYCAVRSASHTQQLLSLSPSFAALTVRLTTATSQPISSAEHSSLVAGTAGSSSQSHCHSSSSSSSGGKTSDSMYRTFFGSTAGAGAGAGAQGQRQQHQERQEQDCATAAAAEQRVKRWHQLLLQFPTFVSPLDPRSALLPPCLPPPAPAANPFAERHNCALSQTHTNTLRLTSAPSIGQSRRVGRWSRQSLSLEGRRERDGGGVKNEAIVSVSVSE